MNARSALRMIGWGWPLVICLMVWAGGADAAETVHMTIKIDGNDVLCDSTILSLDREGTIEGLVFGSTVFVPIDPATGLPASRPTHRPIVLRKRLDQCSPLLMKALVQNQPVEGFFRFFRPNPAGDGTTQHYYTVTIGPAAVAGISMVSPDVIDPATASQPAFEDVSFVYQMIEFMYVPDGVTSGPIDLRKIQ